MLFPPQTRIALIMMTMAVHTKIRRRSTTSTLTFLSPTVRAFPTWACISRHLRRATGLLVSCPQLTRCQKKIMALTLSSTLPQAAIPLQRTSHPSDGARQGLCLTCLRGLSRENHQTRLYWCYGLTDSQGQSRRRRGGGSNHVQHLRLNTWIIEYLTERFMWIQCTRDVTQKWILQFVSMSIESALFLLFSELESSFEPLRLPIYCRTRYFCQL